MLPLVLAQLLAGIAPPPRPPLDWTDLPQLRFVTPRPPEARLSDFVRAEVAAGRCAAATQGPGGWTLRVDFAVLVDAAGRARDAVPLAIGCPTVEQFAAGALSRMVRGNIHPTGAAEGGWARTALTFGWTE